jgi:type I restriction enzyme S subunit
LSQLGRVLGGGTPSKNDGAFWDGNIPWVTPKDMKREIISDSQDHLTEAAVTRSSVKRVPPGSLLMVVRGMILAHSFPTALTAREVTVNQDMKALVPFDEEIGRFLLLLTKGLKATVLRLVERSTHGTCKLSTDALFALPLPIAPWPEQRRIVARVDELMTLVERLDAARAARETTRVAARNSALDALHSAEKLDEVETAWTRFAARIDDLVCEPTDIAPLRQSILQLAVRGRLLPQDSADEPASLLLARITTEKARLVRTGQIRVARTLSPLNADEMPFDLPSGWSPVRFGDVFLTIFTGPFGTSLKKADYQKDGVPVINPQNFRAGSVYPTAETCVGGPTLQRLKNFRMKERDVVVARRGEMGRCAVIGSSEEGWLCGTGSLVLRPPIDIESHFVTLFLRSPWTVSRLSDDSVGATMMNLNQRIMVNLPFGLPPLAEQRRIVSRVDELMRLLDRFEERLASAQTAQAAFAAAAVHYLDV